MSIMLNPDSREEIFKKLTFGVKRTKHFKKIDKNEENDCKKLRIRLLPDEDIVGANGITEEDYKNEDSESDIVKEPQLLSGSNLSLKDGKKKIKFEERKRILHSEKVNRLRRLNRIYTWGDNIPDPCINFTDLKGIPKELLKNLNEFDINEPSPIQMQAMPIMHERRDLLASAPTGSGKTLAFAIPIILDIIRLKKLPKYQQGKKLLALILEPTKELSKQTYMQFLKFGQNLPISCTLMQGQELPNDADIIVSTPKRMEFFIENNPSDSTFKWLRWLIVDESDRLFETTEGDSRCFRTQLAKVYQACNGKYTHRGFFSATFSYEVEEWCKTNLHNVAMVCVGARNSAVDSVEQQLVFAGSEHGKVVAIRSLFQQGFEPPALIFVQSKDRARQLFSEMSAFEPPIPVALISSERSEKERDSAIAKFREGSIWVLICTELLGRGLDFRGVNMVVNFDLPTSVVSYIHRIGRTGRAGRRGRAITYFTERDMDVIRPIATVISQAGFPVPEYTLRMRKLTRRERRGFLRHPPKRKNIGVVKKRLMKHEPVVRTDSENASFSQQQMQISERKKKRKVTFNGKSDGKRSKKKRNEGNNVI
uniref:ATP-dependent RNA helicase n=1 Tax=Ascaris suum TaxID=6253 RepID=F1KZ49_ASCSU